MKKALIGLAIFFFLVTVISIKTYWDAGELKTITPHFNGTKTLLNGFVGAEDITIDHEEQFAYISCDDRYAILHGNENKSGTIYILDLKQAGAPPVAAQTFGGPAEIHPHGISLLKKDSISFLFAVNHTHGRHSILAYRKVTDSSLAISCVPPYLGYPFEMMKVYEDSVFMISPNDVLAVDENKFYFTNDHGSRTQRGKMLEDYLRQKKSNVVFFDGEKYSIAAENIAYANGINMSRDGKEVYVASTIGSSILIYDRDAASGKLTLKDEVVLKTGTDNIELDEKGNVWVACHPQLLTFVKHVKDSSNHAPSQVFKLVKNAAGKFEPEEIFLSKGDDLSGSSVAAVSGKTMLIGPVLDRGILRCEME